MAVRCPSFKNEFCLDNFLLQFSDRQCFSTPQWPSVSQACFVAYRAVITTLLIGWPVVDLLTEAMRFYGDRYTLWFLFATNWSLLLLVLAVAALTLAAALHLWRTRKHSEDSVSGLAAAVYGFLYISSSNSALVVSLSFWTYIVYTENAEFFLTPMSQAKHTINSVFVLCDLLINAVPIRILHFIYPMSLAVIYALFNFSYFANAGRGPDGEIFPYREMDWDKNTASCLVTTVVILTLIVIAQFCLYFIFRFRLWMVNVFTNTKCTEIMCNLDIMRGRVCILSPVAKTTSSRSQSSLSNGHSRTHSQGQGGVVINDECQPMTIVVSG